MPRPEKVQAVADIKERLESAAAVFVAEYAGLSVKEQQTLRRGVRASEAEFKVVKMTLARRAAEELGFDDLVELLSGPTGLAFAHQDAAATAKALREFSAEHANLVIKGALLAGELLPPERVSALAELEPREVLLARIAGAFQAPLARMAGLMAALPRSFATALSQLAEKAPAGEPEAEAPVAEAPAPADKAEESPTAEAAEETEAEETEAEATDESQDESTEDDDAGDEPAGDAEDAAVEAEEE
jgi:large subunit ribosomal protein L10